MQNLTEELLFKHFYNQLRAIFGDSDIHARKKLRKLVKFPLAATSGLQNITKEDLQSFLSREKFVSGADLTDWTIDGLHLIMELDEIRRLLKSKVKTISVKDFPHIFDFLE